MFAFFYQSLADLRKESLRKESFMMDKLKHECKTLLCFACSFSVKGTKDAKVWKRLPQDVLKDGKENGWQNITKECQRFRIGKKSKSQKNQTEQTTQNDQSDKFYMLADKIGFKLVAFGF